MFRVVLAVVGVLWGFAASAQDFVIVCPIKGMIEDGVTVLVERAVKESAGAKALIFEVDTPGGLVDSAIETTQAVLKAKCPTVAYVQGMGATSAGALISYSCQTIIMAPDTTIGTATPVVASAEGMQPTGEKEISFMRARMRTLAERNGHNPAIAEAMVDKDIALYAYKDADGRLQIVAAYPAGTAPAAAPQQQKKAAKEPLDSFRRILEPQATDSTPAPAEQPPATQPAPPPNIPPDAELILPSGKLLTLTPQEALKYAVIPVIAPSLDDVLAYLNLPDAEVRHIEATWAERLFRLLTNPVVSGLLLLFGIGGLYLEMKAPGFGLPGVIGIACLLLFFGSHYIIGLANLLDILLVIIGIVLIGIELFLIPGFGLVGASGIICVLLGLYLALTNVTIPKYSWDYARLDNALTSLTIAFLLLAALVYVSWKVFHRTPLYRRLILTYTQQQAQGYVVQTADEAAAIGHEGVTTTMLRPAGRARFGEVTHQVVTQGEYMPAGTPVRIVQVDGNRYVVVKLEDKA